VSPRPLWRWWLFRGSLWLWWRTHWKWLAEVYAWCVLPQWVAMDKEIDNGRRVDGLDVWWVCRHAHCTWFSEDKAARDTHEKHCGPQKEIPF